MKRTQSVCHLCGKPIDKALEFPHPYSFSVDHIEPLSHGGAERARSNLAACHLRCNQSKGNRGHAEPPPRSQDW